MIPTPDNRASLARKKLIRIYGLGIAAFVAMFGSLSLLAVFLAHLK